MTYRSSSPHMEIERDPMITTPPCPDDRIRARRRWSALGFVAAALVMGGAGLWAGPPAGDALAGECFQRGGYMPPPCTAVPGAIDTESIQQAVPDSGVNACQNQAAMATSLGLIPMICPPTVPGQPSGGS